MTSRIIVALDGKTVKESIKLALELQGKVWGFKFNDGIVDGQLGAIRGIGRIMADGKSHDIPQTVGNWVQKLSLAGANLITVQGCNGKKALRAAKQAVIEFGTSLDPVQILAITILTHHTEEECQEIFGCSIRDGVLRFARFAAECGLDGIVCSPHELQLLSEYPEFNNLKRVVPNIRLGEPITGDDQNPKRKATPEEAILWGADLIVVGRAITKAEDPVEVVNTINAQVEAALTKRSEA